MLPLLLGIPLHATNDGSFISVKPFCARPDGAQSCTAVVKVFDDSQAPLAGQSVTLISSRGGSDVTTNALTTTWQLDNRGLPTSMTGPDGGVTAYDYDEAGRLAVQACPEEGVDDECSRRYFGQNLLPRVGDRHDLRRIRSQLFPIRPRIAFQAVRGGEQQHARPDSLLSEKPFDYHAISAVIATPTKDDNPVGGQRREPVRKKLEESAPGVLHQRQARDAVAL